MNILISLQSDSELISYETISLAFVLASFDHHVQLHLTTTAHTVLFDNSTRLHGMAKSLALYDMPNLWLDDFDTLNQSDIAPDLWTMLSPTPTAYPDFDSHLTF